MKTVQTLPDSEKFNGTGFSGFKTKIIVLANAAGLGAYFEGNILKPSPPPDQIGVAPTHISLPPNPTPVYSHSPSLDEWVYRDSIAKALIVLNVKDPIGLGIKTDGTAAEAWSSLTSNYGQNNPMAQLHAKRDLHTTFLRPGVPILEHVLRMRNLWKQANDVGASVTNDQFKSIFIGSLNEEWDTVIPLLYGMSTSAEIISFVTMHSCGANGKQGHTIADCFWPGGGKAGQWPAWWKGRRDGAAANAVDTYVLAAWSIPAATINVYDCAGTQTVHLDGENLLASPETLMNWREATKATISVSVLTSVDPPNPTSMVHPQLDPSISASDKDPVSKINGVAKDSNSEDATPVVYVNAAVTEKAYIVVADSAAKTTASTATRILTSMSLWIAREPQLVVPNFALSQLGLLPKLSCSMDAERQSP
ncbi:unnamed protein product [Mycena citricolor]|uniref:Uncharacterized protein n=1 Tax=Mycena citricolor TaxID=2018698 RepID=A0AAD2HSP6_9AGAR|nr:unnamed protein product [Mycena citricolor]